jgi:hypothetical protein
MQNRDSGVERFHDSAVTSPGSTEGPCLFLEDIRDRLDRVALLKLLGKWVLCQWCACLLLPLLQGRLEKDVKMGGLGSCRVTHITDNKETRAGSLSAVRESE